MKITDISRIVPKTKTLEPPLEKSAMLFPCGMSRSGTTLLTTILDSHSQISLGYELIPPKLPGPTILKQALEEGLSLCNGDFGKCGTALRNSGKKDLGLFMTRCYRAGIALDELREILSKMHKEGLKEISTFKERLAIAYRIAIQKKIKEGTMFFGFKLNSPSVEEAFKLFTGGYFIYIIRNPRDVVASHIKRRFNRTVKEICLAWNNYIKSFEKFHSKHSDVSLIIRYEDLVSQPRKIITEIFQKLQLNIEEEVFQFYESKASVHQGGHPNIENLRKDFFTTSIGRWKGELPLDVVATIEKYCGDKMNDYDYE